MTFKLQKGKNKLRADGPFSLYEHVGPVGDVSSFPGNRPKINSERPAWWPAPKCASVEGCSPPCPASAAQGRTPGSSEIPADTTKSSESNWFPSAARTGLHVCKPDHECRTFIRTGARSAILVFLELSLGGII
ncbi:hypothetical protein CHARACLAT_015498 [Characodon lateralis]|uniref:Uncharacterized protein n=1 Tax=Characodon lateralis TaxID=208331 RepID=A0ABU7DUY2_9TELE|nr:hypothetical protein [Characodon lateralis]